MEHIGSSWATTPSSHRVLSTISSPTSSTRAPTEEGGHSVQRTSVLPSQDSARNSDSGTASYTSDPVCEQCHAKRVRCDRVKPCCGACSRRGRDCSFGRRQGQSTQETSVQSTPVSLNNSAGITTQISSSNGPFTQATPAERHPVLQDGIYVFEEGDSQPAAIIAKIEGILEDIVDALSLNRVLMIPLRSRQSGNEVMIRFPSDRIAGAKKFTALLQILHCIHEALVSGRIVTKRNIYYHNPDLFCSQAYVDQLVDDIAFTFGVGRDALNVRAASKGLVAGGNFDIIGQDHHGVPIPHTSSLDGVDFHSSRWILVIEKEATFRSLVASRYFELSAAGPGILITAKGYPDLATRQFLHLVQSSYPHIPIHALVDFDPDGLAIMRTYKHGSRSLDHEENVTLPGLYWLGVKSSDVLDPQRHLAASPLQQLSQQSGNMPPSCQLSASSNVHPPNQLNMETLCTLTSNDRKKAVNLLRSLNNQHDQDTEEMMLTRELQLMLMLNKKAEIQALDDSMTAWLNEHLCA
ncbi:Spo11/DNA topoisomerase VI subunit A [Pseudomassariella vexata]|uniref:DNA topoisomerase (ATP-hydrolyzing) n=1 Tax=Pseudomassariella vexata TaxID=1141098 RepID=A0A1Y2EKS7_9PEZI|nr:Spo11/DNA topoisomerase VI subunit A [Pseudomassariella vexata]ORY72153.1 Spo11/DNA topoisomerase VI subunit A [Pseudomassariella vexata]